MSAASPRGPRHLGHARRGEPPLGPESQPALIEVVAVELDDGVALSAPCSEACGGPPRRAVSSARPPVAQWIRATDFGSVGRGFESLRAGQMCHSKICIEETGGASLAPSPCRFPSSRPPTIENPPIGQPDRRRHPTPQRAGLGDLGRWPGRRCRTSCRSARSPTSPSGRSGRRRGASPFPATWGRSSGR